MLLKAAGDVKVNEHGRAVGADNDVLRLDIPVDDRRVVAVQGFQNAAELVCDREDLLLAHVMFPCALAQRLTLNVFPHDAEHLLVVVFPQELRKPRVIQVGQKAVVRLEREQGPVIALGHGGPAGGLFLDQKGLAAAVAGQAFHLVVGSEKFHGIAALCEDGLDVLNNMPDFLHLSRPPRFGRSRSSRMSSVSTREIWLCRQ